MAKDWDDYQEKVGDFFRTLGLTVTTNATVEGARGSHKVDVWAVSSRYGFEVKWLVECKFWQTSVPKEKLFTLYQIAQDIGADRAFLLSESGFQSGAIRAAQNTNITLTSLQDLQNVAQEEIFDVELSKLAHKITLLDEKIQSFMSDEGGKPFPHAWIDQKELLDIAGPLLELKLSNSKAESRKFPVYLGIGQSRTATKLDSLEDYIIGANKSLIYISEAVAEFEAVTLGVQQQSRGCFIKLVDAVRKLMINAEEALFSLEGDAVRFKEPRRRSLEDMREVGKAADEVKLAAFGQLRAQIFLLMRLLIDSTYLHLTEATIPQQTWDKNKKAVASQLEKIDAMIALIP